MPARSRPLVTSRGRSASCGISNSTCRSRRSAAPRSSATAPSRRIVPRRAGHPVDLRPRAQHGLPLAGPGVGRGCRRRRHRHRGQRAGLLRLSRLPPGVPAGVRAARARLRRKRACRVDRCACSRRCVQLSKASIIRRGVALGVDYGLTHSCYDPAPDGQPVRSLRQLLCCAPAASAEAGIADPVVKRSRA